MPLTVDGSMNGGFDLAGWRAAVERYHAALSHMEGVLALVVAGSGADPALLDRWSDVDLVVVVADAAMARFSGASDWLAPMGEVYAQDSSSEPSRLTVRVCFTDLHRVDFIVVPASRLDTFAAAPGPLQRGARVLIDRTDGALGAALGRVPRAPSDADRLAVDDSRDAGAEAQEAFRRLEREFRWNGVLAAVKVGRGDLLIGGHLALEMAQSCLVLAMLLRDRALGTRHHRHGDGIAPPLRLPPALTAEGVADMIVAATACWAQLSAQWDPAYVFPKAPLLALLDRHI